MFSKHEDTEDGIEECKKDPFEREIREKVPLDLQEHLNERDGAAILSQKLPRTFSPQQIAHATAEQRAWELVGLSYFKT